MAQVIWTDPALQDLDAIADYIALDNLPAAKRLVAKIFEAVSRLERFPQMGSKPPELRGMPYRQVIVRPCRIFYRVRSSRVVIVHVMRGEQWVDESQF
jgi:toxin ParE1/3/4